MIRDARYWIFADIFQPILADIDADIFLLFGNNTQVSPVQKLQAKYS